MVTWWSTVNLQRHTVEHVLVEMGGNAEQMGAASALHQKEALQEVTIIPTTMEPIARITITFGRPVTLVDLLKIQPDSAFATTHKAAHLYVTTK